jgi:ankyrin repeat protein
MSLKSLAPELLLMIAARLDARSLASLIESCRPLHDLLNRDLLHRALEISGGGQALSHAARIDSLSLARALLSIGADPNHETPDYYPALHYAALRGNMTMVRLLLEHGASLELQADVPPEELRLPPFNPDREYLYSFTVLGCAVCHNDPVLTKFLLDEREKCGILNDLHEGECAELFDLAIDQGFADIVRVFLTLGDVGPVSLGWLLRKPVHAGNAEIVDVIITAGADVEAPPSNWRPLHTASQSAYPEVVKTLLRHGAEVDPLSHGTHDQPKTPLVAAAKLAALGPSEAKLSSLPEHLREEETQRCLQGAKEVMSILADWGADVDWAIHLTNGLHIPKEAKERIIAILQTYISSHQ